MALINAFNSFRWVQESYSLPIWEKQIWERPDVNARKNWGIAPPPPFLKAIAPPRKVVHIIPALLGGYGDVKGAIAIRDGMRRALPAYEVFLAVFPHSLSQLRPFLKQLGKKVVVLDGKDAFKADLTVYYPSGSSTELPLFDYLANTTQPHLLLYEYGYQALAHQANIKVGSKKMGAHALGFDFAELGILIHEGLYRFSQRNLDSLQRLAYLKELPASLGKALVQESVFDLPQPISSKALANFEANSQLYVGYSTLQVSKDLFLQILAQLRPQKEICVVLVGEPLDPATSWPGLKSKGINAVEFYEAYHEYEAPVRIASYQTSRKAVQHKMRVYSLHQVEYRTMTLLLQASQKETLATGDQSLGDALVAGKYPIYEMHQHKRALTDSLIARALLFDSALLEIVKGLVSGFPVSGYAFQEGMIYQAYSTKDAKRGADLLRRLRLQEFVWKRFVAHLHTLNCISKIVALVYAYLGY